MTYRCLELLDLCVSPFFTNQRVGADASTSRPPSAEDEEMPRPSYLLDIGAGSGLSGEILTEEGHQWVGVDVSGGMLGKWELRLARTPSEGSWGAGRTGRESY